MISKKELEFYKKQGIRTKVKKGTFDDFPDNIGEICRIIQGLLIHPADLDLYNLKLSEKRINDRNKKSIQDSLDEIKVLDNRPLIEHREPQKRVVDICRQFSMFLCSVLREKGIPARCRCGFATYFEDGWFEDHWICEYWNAKEKRWIRVDSEIDDLEVLKCHMNRKNIDFLDLPKEAFFSAGVLWELYRQGLAGGKLCGYSPEGEEGGESGEWYIRGNMLRDFFALNKVEYTYREENKLMDKNHKPNKEELILLDKIADLTIKSDEKFEELISFYKNNKDLIPNLFI